MNPWLSIWFHPRQTIRQIVDTNPRRWVLLIAAASGAAGGAMQAGRFVSIFHTSFTLLPVLVCLMIGAFIGVLSLYLFGWLYRWVGSWLGGQATAVEVRAAIAWVELPVFAVFGLWLVLVLLSPEWIRTSGQWTHAPSLAGVLVGIAGIVVGIWRLVLKCHTLGEVHRFSAWKGFGTILIPSTLLMIPIAVLAMFSAIAIPNVLRARIAANESAAIGNLRALVAGLELRRSVKGTYPTTAHWDEMYPAGREQSYGPLRFQTPGTLTDYEVQRYRYTYTSVDGTHYAIRASATEAGVSGGRSFYVDDTGTIRHCNPNAHSHEVGGLDRELTDAPQPCH